MVFNNQLTKLQKIYELTLETQYKPAPLGRGGCYRPTRAFLRGKKNLRDRRVTEYYVIHFHLLYLG